MNVLDLEETDGRRRRSLDSRARIVNAMLELTRETAVAPSAEQVAQRAGVGLRTVFRHFQDMDSLYSEIARPFESELRLWAQRPFKGATWQDRVFELIARRGTAFETVAPLRRASDAMRHNSAVLQAQHAVLTTSLRTILRGLIPKGAVDVSTFEALDLLLGYEAWSRLRREQGLSPAQARKTLQTAVKALVGGG
ncbi:MAG TPA: TetR/AcrR family transcriptional regulator [Caulobacteraceae bacterium]|nr:TetR/AcrR family transcriptional regulator [Caulobacteraceae bacterium]